MSIRRSNDAGDFRSAIWMAALIELIPIIIIGLIMLAVCWCVDDNFAECQRYNNFAKMANSELTTEQRKAVVELAPEYKDCLNEDGVFIERNEPRITSSSQFIAKTWKTIAIILICMFSVFLVLFYSFEHSMKYYFADLPFKTFSGWFVLIFGFVAWPVFVISRIRFYKFKKGRCYVKLPETVLFFNEDEYVAFYQTMNSFDKRISNAEENLVNAKENAKYISTQMLDYKQKLKEEQANVNHWQATLNELKVQAEQSTTNPVPKEQILHDFEEIKAMRGVKQIFTKVCEGLVIIVRAEYEYEGDTYDIGDYRIEIDKKSDFVVRRIRHSSERGFYGGNFCFGDNKEAINAYLAENRIVEAVELIIEGINHINDDDVSLVPRYYKKIKN